MIRSEEFTISLIMMVLISASLITYFQIEKVIGRHQIFHYLMNRYKTPRSENRIFMFLDLTASTTFIEDMGNEKYYRFLNDYFTDMTIPILEAQAEIYQYVGDENVFSWEHKDGLKKSNCINIFYMIKDRIHHRRNYYLKNYGNVPAFKAAVHYGSVVSAQIGHLKNEIIYCGDPLNTTARIEALCRKYNSELLISEKLAKKMDKNGFNFKSIGELKLRGKKDPIGIQSAIPLTLTKNNRKAFNLM